MHIYRGSWAHLMALEVLGQSPVVGSSQGGILDLAGIQEHLGVLHVHPLQSALQITLTDHTEALWILSQCQLEERETDGGSREGKG